MLRITGNNDLSTQADEKKQNLDGLKGDGGASISSICGGINNQSSIVKSAKYKKPKLTKSNFSRINFLNLEAKKAFIYL